MKEKIASHAWARRNYRGLLDAAHDRVSRTVTIPDRGGQWPHWYACQSCGTRLVTESPTVHRCPSCDLVNSGEPWDSVPLTAVHNRLSEEIRDFGVCYALSGERVFAEKAAEMLLGYAEMYPHYPVRDHHQETDTKWASKVSWGTLGESVWLIPVCCGYDLIRHADVLRPVEHQAIREQLIRPAAQLILKHNIGIHNIQCWHNCAIGMAALMLRDPELLAYAVDGEVGIHEQIEQGVRPDGMWHEGSWGYHFYGMTPILGWAVALRNCGLDLFSSRLKAMFEAPLKAVRPDGGMPAFHDSGGSPIVTQARHYEIAYASFADDALAEPIRKSKREDLSALLYGAPVLPESDLPSLSTIHLSDSGFIYARQGSAKRQMYVAFDYGPHGGGHGHPDKLGFILFGRGALQAPDPGSVAYGIPIHKAWFTQTISHNTVVVDGQSQQPTEGELQFLASADGIDILRADAGDAYEGVQLARTMVVTEDAVLIVDRVRSDRVHTYDWVYHNLGTLRPGFSRRKLKTPLGETDGYDVIEDLRRARPEEGWQATWKQDGSGVRLTMIESKRQTEVYTGVGPANIDDPGVGFASEDVPFVIARRAGRRRTTFAAALQLFGSRPAKDELVAIPLEQADRGRAYRYRRNKTDLTLIVPFLQGRLSFESLTFRGAAALIDQGQADRVILCEGSHLEWQDTEIVIEPDGSVEVSEEPSGMRIQNLSDEALEVTVGGRSTSLPAGRAWRVPRSSDK